MRHVAALELFFLKIVPTRFFSVPSLLRVTYSLPIGRNETSALVLFPGGKRYGPDQSSDEEKKKTQDV